MKMILTIGALFLSASAVAQAQSGKSPPPRTTAPRPTSTDLVQQPTASGNTFHDPWDIAPPVAPYLNLAEDIKAASGQAAVSPLNPSCEGKTGDACVRSAETPTR